MARKITLLAALRRVPDPRQPSNGTRHRFEEILVIAVCAMLADQDTIEDIANWGRDNEDWLRQFLVLPNGIPSAETFLRIFRLLDPLHLERAFRRWTSGLLPALGDQVAIDGKALRNAVAKGARAPHMVSAFDTANSIVLGQEKVSDKSNEITAIPPLLDDLYLAGCLVTIDAMGCQKDIAAGILDKKADYLLAVKGNQPTLQTAIETAFIDHRKDMDGFHTVEKSHGRGVGQSAWVAPAAGIVDPDVWPQCRTIGIVLSQRVVHGQAATPEWRFYLSSRDLSAEALYRAAHRHWAVENRLHWMLDVDFGEDLSMLRKDNAPQNISLLRKLVLNLIRTSPARDPKRSFRGQRKRCAGNKNLLAQFMGLNLC